MMPNQEEVTNNEIDIITTTMMRQREIRVVQATSSRHQKKLHISVDQQQPVHDEIVKSIQTHKEEKVLLEKEAAAITVEKGEQEEVKQQVNKKNGKEEKEEFNVEDYLSFNERIKTTLIITPEDAIDASCSSTGAFYETASCYQPTGEEATTRSATATPVASGGKRIMFRRRNKGGGTTAAIGSTMRNSNNNKCNNSSSSSSTTTTTTKETATATTMLSHRDRVYDAISKRTADAGLDESSSHHHFHEIMTTAIPSNSVSEHYKPRAARTRRAISLTSSASDQIRMMRQKQQRSTSPLFGGSCKSSSIKMKQKQRPKRSNSFSSKCKKLSNEASKKLDEMEHQQHQQDKTDNDAPPQQQHKDDHIGPLKSERRLSKSCHDRRRGTTAEKYRDLSSRSFSRRRTTRSSNIMHHNINNNNNMSSSLSSSSYHHHNNKNDHRRERFRKSVFKKWDDFDWGDDSFTNGGFDDSFTNGGGDGDFTETSYLVWEQPTPSLPSLAEKRNINQSSSHNKIKTSNKDKMALKTNYKLFRMLDELATK